MGHRNTQFNGHLNDMETDQQGHSHLHSEPSIFYGSLPNFPHPCYHSMVPAPGNHGSLTFHHIPEHHDCTLLYGMPQLNGPRHQHPAPNLDLAIAAPSGHYGPYLPPPSENYTRIIPYSECTRSSFKRKNAEGASGSFQYHNASAGPSSPAISTESDVALLDPVFFPPPEFVGNDSTLIVENGSQRSGRNRIRIFGESVVAHNPGHLVHGNFASPPVQLPGNPWVDMHFGPNNGDISTFAWNQSPIPYTHVSDMSASNMSPGGFLPPPIPQGHPVAHNPSSSMQGSRGYNVNLPSQVAASIIQISSTNSSSTGINHFQDIADTGSSFVSAVPPVSFRSYRPHRRELVIDSSARHQALPHMRVLPEDEVAILGIPAFHEAGDPIDQHRDLRLDIDHMTYEELLELGEQIGSVGTGLPLDFIRNHLKVRIFSSSTYIINLEEDDCLDQPINFCVICQSEYEGGDAIATVECGHEYHSECIKKWLLTKNTCPICKATALNRRGRGL